MTPPTEEQLAELERLEREALPGPWRTGRHPDPSCDVAYVLPHGMPGEEAATIYLDDSERHAAFIVAARNALPALIQEVRRLRDENAMFRGTLAAIAGREVES